MFTTGPSLAAAGFDVLLPVVSPPRPAPSCVCSPRRPSARRRSVCSSSPTCAGRCSSTTSNSTPPASPGSGQGSQAAGAGPRSLGPHRPAPIWTRPRRPWPSGPRSPSCRARPSIRHAVGLEGTASAGPVRVDGSGWAADLLRGATTHPPAPIDTPDGFAGQLPHYQAEAAGWLGFLDRAGLGGCLAMDMGLGKTPTLLAHLLVDRGHGPTLVICPPAVLSNWASEARRFTRGLKVAVHHGPRIGPRATPSPAWRPPRRGAHHLRHRRARHREPLAAHRPGGGSSSTRPRSSRTTRATPPRSCAASPPTPGWP